jgi:hypothetical protein
VAARIGELKKPTVSAGVVNQLARERELDIQRLVKAGEALEQAQRDAMSSGDATAIQTARREEDAAIRRLLDAAGDVAPTSGTTLDRVAKTLRAAAATEEGRRLVKQGRLAEDLEPPGFEALAGLAIGTARPRTRKAKPARDDRRELRRQIETLRRRQRDAEEASQKSSDEARELERRAREAEQTARKATQAAATARKRADADAARAKRLKEELSELQRR